MARRDHRRKTTRKKRAKRPRRAAATGLSAAHESRKLRLVMYSGGVHKGNERIHDKLSRILGHKARSLTYVPSSHENGEYYFRRIRKRYSRYGFKKFRYFAVDSDFLMREMRDALKSDVIYLAGGNTYYFLKHLRESGFLKRLTKFAVNGGVVAGLSAGAIIMTPSIDLAGYPPPDADLNEVKLKNWRALGLVEFEFLPHFSNSKLANEAMLRYSRRGNRLIFACPDGSGIVVDRGGSDGGDLHIFGPVYIFYRGKKMRLT
jgi:dipeptidase E